MILTLYTERASITYAQMPFQYTMYRDYFPIVLEAGAGTAQIENTGTSLKKLTFPSFLVN